MKRPADTKVQIDDVQPGVWKIIIPGRPTGPMLFACLFLLCWLAGLAVGGTFALRALMQRRFDMEINLTLLLWMLGWTLTGGVAMVLLKRVLGICFGREGLLFRPDRLTFVRVLWGRQSESDYEMKRVDRFVRGGRGLRLKAGGKAVAFGAALTDEESAWLEGELNRILKEVQSHEA